MKSLKVFSIVLVAHLLAVPIVIIQISRDPGKVAEVLATDNLTDEVPVQQVGSTIPTLNVGDTLSTQVHIVRQGDNPSAIAARYGMRTAELMELNQIKDARGLRVGDKLKVYSRKI